MIARYLHITECLRGTIKALYSCRIVSHIAIQMSELSIPSYDCRMSTSISIVPRQCAGRRNHDSVDTYTATNLEKRIAKLQENYAVLKNQSLYLTNLKKDYAALQNNYANESPSTFKLLQK